VVVTTAVGTCVKKWSLPAWISILFVFFEKFCNKLEKMNMLGLTARVFSHCIIATRISFVD
jgi:hypothetical protein